jgi:thiol-disulfide isomerase/thioredoxin
MRSILLTSLLLFSSSILAKNFTLLSEAKGKTPLLDVMESHVTKANALNQDLYIQITATWCGPCKRLQAAMPNELMQEAFAGTYIVKLDADEWKEDFSSIDITIKAVPTFYQVTSEAKAGNYTVNGGAWAEDIPENMAPVLKTYFKN